MEILGLILLSLLADVIWGGVSYVVGRALLEFAWPWRRKRAQRQLHGAAAREAAELSAGKTPAQSPAAAGGDVALKEGQEAGDLFFVWLLGTIFLLMLFGGICLLVRWL